MHALAERLTLGGYLHAATDWEDYAIEMLATLEHETLLVNTATDFAPRPAYRPLTKFERRGLARGHGVWDLIFLPALDRRYASLNRAAFRAAMGPRTRQYGRFVEVGRPVSGDVGCADKPRRATC